MTIRTYPVKKSFMVAYRPLAGMKIHRTRLGHTLKPIYLHASLSSDAGHSSDYNSACAHGNSYKFIKNVTKSKVVNLSFNPIQIVTK